MLLSIVLFAVLNGGTDRASDCPRCRQVRAQALATEMVALASVFFVALVSIACNIRPWLAERLFGKRQPPVPDSARSPEVNPSGSSASQSPDKQSNAPSPLP